MSNNTSILKNRLIAVECQKKMFVSLKIITTGSVYINKFSKQ